MPESGKTFGRTIGLYDSLFARLSLEKGYASRQDLLQAYKAQIARERDGLGVSALPQILLERGIMTSLQVDAVMSGMFASVATDDPAYSREPMSAAMTA